MAGDARGSGDGAAHGVGPGTRVALKEVMREQHDDDLEPRLRAVEETLGATLEEVCADQTPEEMDTGELIRVEETLAIAAQAAKEAVTLRRKRKARGDAG